MKGDATTTGIGPGGAGGASACRSQESLDSETAGRVASLRLERSIKPPRLESRHRGWNVPRRREAGGGPRMRRA